MNSRKEKLAVVAIGFLLMATLGAVIYDTAFDQGMEYQRHFDDAIGVNRDGDAPTLKGHLYVYVKRGDSDQWVLLWSHANLITNVGRNGTRNQIGGTPTAVYDYVQVGTGTGGSASSEDLVTPFSTRQQGAYDDTAVAYNWTITTTFAAGFFAGETITEYAVFNAVSGGIMLNYQESVGDTLSATDSLQVIFEFMITDAG